MGYYATDPVSTSDSHNLKTATPAISGDESGHRFYSTTLGRWVSRDVIGERGGLNRYAIGSNRSGCGLDILGAKWLEIGRWTETGGSYILQYYVRLDYVCECKGSDCAWKLTDGALEKEIVEIELVQRSVIVEKETGLGDTVMEIISGLIGIFKPGYGAAPSPSAIRYRSESMQTVTMTFSQPTVKRSLGECNCDTQGSSDYTRRPTHMVMGDIPFTPDEERSFGDDLWMNMRIFMPF